MRTVAGLLVGLTFLVSGCGSTEVSKDSELSIGTVDVMRVMEERPETVQIKLEWAAQAGSTYLEMTELTNQDEQAALQSKVARSSEQWRQRMAKFVADSVKEVEAAGAAVAKERNLDIVLVDNPLTRPIKYLEGDDITLDVMLKIQSDS